ncbi:7142_t:CDS:2, partial [Cetraspora pellucida]
MPKCLYCKKVFINQQALGNHVKKHLDDSDEDLSLPNKVIYTNLVKITDLGEINSNINSFVENQNPSVSSFNCINNIRNYESQDVEFFDYTDFQSNTSDGSIEEQVIELFDQSDSQSNDHSDFQSNDHSDSQSNNHSDSQSNISDVQSDLSDITD